MFIFFENTWPLLWVIAIVVLVRWFHVNALGADPDEIEETSGDHYSSRGARPHAI